SFISLCLFPQKTIKNLLRLKKKGAFGQFGFYDSMDFNSKRITPAYYSHHLGFSLASICNFLEKREIQKLFSDNSIIAASEYLLEELYIIDTKPSPLPKKEPYAEIISPETIGLPIKEFIPVKTQLPQSMFLSNGKLFASISNNGNFSLATKSILLTPFSRLETKNQGWQIFLKDNNSKFKWSITSPVNNEEVKYRIAFHENLAEFNTKYNNIEAQTEITISPHENLEIRKVVIKNQSNKIKNLCLQTRGQPLLSNQQKELLAPYFHRLFLRLNFFSKYKAWFINRSYLFPDDENINLVHWVVSPQKRTRINFSEKQDFSCNPFFGNSIDFKLKPEEEITIYCFTGFVSSQQDLKTIIKKYNKAQYCSSIFENINQQESSYLQLLNVNYAKAKTYRKLGSQIFWQDPDIKHIDSLVLTQKQDFLWKLGISGDFPIIIVPVKNLEDIPLVNEFIKANFYWQFKGIKLDLIFLNQEEKSYTEPLREQLEAIINREKLKNVYLISKNNLTDQELASLKSLAIGYFPNLEKNIPIKKEQVSLNNACKCSKEGIDKKELSFFNSYGGFLNQGKEYVILADKKYHPNLPWINILANEKFGCLTSHYGLNSTWHLNSQQNRLTPWTFSPIKKPISEMFYLKEKDCIWSLTLEPLPNNNIYQVTHGRGYTEYENKNHGIVTKLKVFVHPEESCKYYQIIIENETKEEKQVSLTSFFPLVLTNFAESQTPLQISKKQDIFLAEQILENKTGKVKVGFWSSEKVENYSFYQPDIFSRNSKFLIPELSEKPEKPINSYPCVSFNTKLDISAKTKKQILILMAVDPEEEKIEEIIKNNQIPEITLEKQKEFWEKETLRIKTPSPELNIIFNYWLIYQTISSRIFAKTGAYQQGGAFGFRDQIQDLLSLIYINPKKVREMLIYFSSKQFEQGDVLNWWHEPAGLGARTLISDTHLWFPYVLYSYIQRTGDKSILDETTPYLKGDLVDFEQTKQWFGIPEKTSYQVSLYEHALKSLQKSFNFGKNKLPLMGSADWNDGLSLIGPEGKG
ncbi:MAG: hypothetical protein PHN37_03225, partial [Candidatus Pacebacteria bacterium]|nr:hypothetical protein [Candidatus Paceibacterota bacterium]